MDDTKIPLKNCNRKFQGRRPVGRPRQRWEDIRRGSSFLLNTGGWRRLSSRQGPMLAVASFKEKKKNIQCLIVYKLYPLLLKVVYPACTHVTDHGTRSENICPLGNIPLTDSLEHTNKEECPKISTGFKLLYFPWI
jgi:hypothetical protein